MCKFQIRFDFFNFPEESRRVTLTQLNRSNYLFKELWAQLCLVVNGNMIKL